MTQVKTRPPAFVAIANHAGQLFSREPLLAQRFLGASIVTTFDRGHRPLFPPLDSLFEFGDLLSHLFGRHLEPEQLLARVLNLTF